MKNFIRTVMPASLLFISFNAQSQVTKLSNNTNLTCFTVNNRPILTSDIDSTLWTTNGTASGTIKFTSKAKFDESRGAGVLNNKLFFAGSDAARGYELWVTDGTDAGTNLVKEIMPGSTGSGPSDFAILNNKLLFFAEDNLRGKELWITDGSGGGTHLLKDINPGGNSFIENKTSFYLHKNTLFFVADDGVHGAELWKTDGSEAGTVRVSDINISGDGFTANYTQFFSFNNILLFAANDGLTGTELWKTDGTTAGTQRLKDIRAQTITDSSSNPSNFILYKNKVYFTATKSDFQALESDFWVTDGTSNGTMQVDAKDGPRLTLLIQSAVLNDNLIFSAFNTKTISYELWSSDGTAAGTKVLKANTNPFIFSRYSADENNRSINEAVYNGRIYFLGTDDENGRQLWSTDGTADGTKMLTKIYGGSGSISEKVYPSVYFTKSGLFFTAAKQGVAGKSDIWKTDGTAAGTKFVASLDAIADEDNATHPIFYFIYNNQLYFSHDDGDNADGLRDFYKLNETVSPLPVTLLSFTAALQSKSVKLDWSTSTEINSSYFTVERSMDANHFENIGKVNAAGNSSLKRSYEYDDAQALQAGSVVLYYRLKMVDKDGAYKYSRTVNVHLHDLTVDVKLSPNPSKDILTITFANAGSGNISLLINDASGKPVYLQNFSNAGSQQRINTGKLAAGVYYLQVVTNGQIITRKFVKE